jgi:two-component system, sensor histidine kinase
LFHETSNSRSAEASASAPVAPARRSRWLKAWRSWLSGIADRFTSGGRSDVEKLEDIKDAHWELADCASHYRQFLDAQQDFIVRRSGDGHVVFANAAFCNAFDVRREDVVGSMFQPPVIRTEAPAKPSANHRRFELLRTRSGKRWIAWDESKVRNDLGEPEVQSVGRDVTIERAAEEGLKEACDQANSASRAKSRFLASMSHEIRTPMTGILGMISLMHDTHLDDEQRTYARAVEDSARALLGLIDDILDFSKIEAGKLDISKEPFSLRTCVAQAVQLVAPQASAKGLSLTSTVAADVPDHVRGDEMRVRQIILNLLFNAVKFTDNGGVKLHLALARRQAARGGSVSIAIEVEDTGIGFPSEMMLQLFQEFEQGEVAAGRQPGGTGLGLAISRRLARAMGGDIIARGAPYEGATFTAVLRFEIVEPVSRETGTTARPRGRRGAITKLASESRIPCGGAFCVLVAEDNEINALLSRKVIERAGGRAIVVKDGRSAIAAVWEAIERRNPILDLILMDVLMPGIDGLMAAKSIKSLYVEHRHLGLTSPPIIALTANAFPEDRERCRAAGMDDYLAKPFDAQHLENLLLRWAPQRIGKTSPAA